MQTQCRTLPMLPSTLHTPDSPDPAHEPTHKAALKLPAQYDRTPLTVQVAAHMPSHTAPDCTPTLPVHDSDLQGAGISTIPSLAATMNPCSDAASYTAAVVASTPACATPGMRYLPVLLSVLP